jgi:nicotinate-nucleotide adenylyltransferase
MSKIGIMGGTFNPIHFGHLFLAENARTFAGLDKVLFMPSKNPPHKKIASEVTQKQREAMIRLAIEDNPHFEFSDFELQRDGYTYTADTLTLLHEENPETQYYFIVGTDSLFMMQDWMQPQTVFSNCTVLVAGRDQADEEKIDKHIAFLKRTFDADILYIKMPMLDIASEDIRARIASGNSVKYYMPDSVIEYIKSNGLYSLSPDLSAIRKDLKEKLKTSRYIHSIGVEEVAHDLAVIHNCDVEKAVTAGILHDCAKYLSDEELLKECEKYHLPVSDIEIKCPFLLHAKVGAAFATTFYGVDDEEILNAIRYHTTGRPSMTLLEKIIYIADYIEPNRKPLPRIQKIREAAYDNIDLAVFLATENILTYLKSKGQAIDMLTEETFGFNSKVVKASNELE